uniref:AB hydrolase-1 domain-containing protein n=1 Tax=Kwoniella bestiolae CBS 10118 TaxID=1296100 RepID=A0A1B9GEE7_9TREE|nr:hypothetical protein I302_00867 [Kwoniella bestiolae CBS 10118]OCF29365.1 hypothetical protein I302_00867 [Kwoniella bestiolae CBS 10118]
MVRVLRTQRRCSQGGISGSSWYSWECGVLECPFGVSSPLSPSHENRSMLMSVYCTSDYLTYSFAENAAAAGWATLSYDRLGVGRSAKPDGTNVVQAAFEIAQSVAIAQKHRDGTLSGVGKIDKIVGIGHSYGSALVTGLASVSPTSFDAIVLTGFTNNVTLGSLGLTALQLTIASVAYPDRFEGLPNDYVISASSAADQVVFFHYPNYTQDAFEEFTRTKGEFILGQFTITNDRTNYKNPLFVDVGEYDAPVCTANCSITSIVPTEQIPNPSQLDSTRELFPSVENFQTYVIPDTAHGINYSPTARLAYEKIFDFVEGLGL